MSINNFVYRPAEVGKDKTCIAKLWHDVYHESHGDLVPAELLKFRTLESFAIRVAETSFLNETTVAIKIQDQVNDAPDHVVGFIATRAKDYEISIICRQRSSIFICRQTTNKPSLKTLQIILQK